MTTLLDLLDLITEQPITGDADFDKWLHQHADLVGRIESLALHRAAQGQTRLSMKAIFETVRREAVQKGTTYALTNSMTAPLARYLMDRHPSLADKFVTRKRRAA